MDSIAIVSASFGGRDRPRPQVEQDVPCSWWFFQDGLVEVDSGLPWRYMLRNDDEGNSNLAAKRYKMLPDSVFPDCPRWVVWVDANMEITSPSFVRNSLAAIRNGIAVSAHPRRDCVYEEAKASLGDEGQNGRYAGLGIERQVEHYRAEGLPAHGGLYACGVVAWDMADPHAHNLGAAWLDECHSWTIQDQLSLPMVLWRHRIAPGVFPIAQLEPIGPRRLGNRWVRIRRHGS